MPINIETIPITRLIKDKLMDKIEIHNIESRDAEADRAIEKLAEYLADIAYGQLYEQ